MTAPVEHLLKVFRTFLPNNVAAVARTDPLAVTVPQILNPMMRELIDDSESRRRLAAAPAFPCKLRKLSVASNTKQNTNRDVSSTFIGSNSNVSSSSAAKANNFVTVENETNIALWSAVLPWETSLGLSHVKLNSYYSRGNDASSSTETNKSLENIPRGMLFVSRGIEEATSDLNGEFVKWAPNQSFWSGAIRQSIDVLFVQSKKPIPKKATLARRDDGEIAAVLSDPFRNGYGCRVQDVQRLDPFERFNNKEEEATLSPESKNSEKKKTKSLPQHVYDFVFEENSSSSRSYSVLCPKSANAPFFVLELPGGFTEEKIIRPASSSSSSSKNNDSQSYVELELGEEICKDIDTKMMIERHFVPVLKAATNEILKRMCREVLQRGAKYVLEEMEGQRRSEETKLGFGKTNDDKTTSENNNDNKIAHEWSDEDTEFLCMSTRLSLTDFELCGTAWDVLADYISRHDENVLQQEQQGEKEEKVKFFFDKLPQSFDQIWKLMNDGSLCLPDSIMRLMIQEQARREEEKFKL